MMPHMFVSSLSVDAPADLPRAKLRGFEAQRPKLFRDAFENLGVVLALPLQLTVPARDVLVDLEPQRVEHLVHRPGGLRAAETQNALEPLLDRAQRDAHALEGARHWASGPVFCPESGRQVLFELD